MPCESPSEISGNERVREKIQGELPDQSADEPHQRHGRIVDEPSPRHRNPSRKSVPDSARVEVKTDAVYRYVAELPPVLSKEEWLEKDGSNHLSPPAALQ